MKKLMIAAAIAALAGGAFADAAYDFVATLKTTKAKEGTKTYTTYYLGMDENSGKFWYEDAEYANITAANKAKKTIGGKEIDSLKIVNGKLADENAADIAKIIVLSGKYDKKSAGQWCCVVKLPTEAKCYRVVGTRKIQETFWAAKCCTAGAATELKAKDEVGAEIGTIKPAAGLLQLFGAQTYAKANKGEIYAPIKFTTARDWNFEGALAGQGSFGKITDKNGVAGEGPTSINGYVVGKMDAPKCEYCCSKPEDSGAFDCANGEIAPLPKTAGFGAFRLKYNRSKSTF